jgi:hypothetical protein
VGVELSGGVRLAGTKMFGVVVGTRRNKTISRAIAIRLSGRRGLFFLLKILFGGALRCIRLGKIF